MEINEKMLSSFRLYCKIDIDFEDELLKDLIEGCADQLAYAIEAQPDVDKWMKNKRFCLGVKKQVKEEYEHRGLTSDYQRYPLANGVLNIIHQLRDWSEDNDDSNS